MPMIWSSVFRWIMNVVLYATMPDARVQRDPVTTKHWQRMQKAKGTARKEAERRWRRLGHRMIVGQGVEALGDALKERVLVTGHYRHVVHGPRRSLRRRQWIEPYYKGPEDAPESRTQHRL